MLPQLVLLPLLLPLLLLMLLLMLLLGCSAALLLLLMLLLLLSCVSRHGLQSSTRTCIITGDQCVSRTYSVPWGS